MKPMDIHKLAALYLHTHARAQMYTLLHTSILTAYWRKGGGGGVEGGEEEEEEEKKVTHGIRATMNFSSA